MGLDRTIDITAEQRKIVLALLQRHLPNTTAWVYGSRAKWTSSPQSDLDLVVFATPEQNGRVSYLREALEESSLPFRVDLFVWDTVPEQFRKHIKRDHVVMVEREERNVVGEWCSTTIGGLLAADGGGVKTGPFGTALKAKEYSKVGVPLISVGEIGYGSLRLHEKTPRAPREVVERLPEYLLEAGDIVFGRKGAVDRSALVKPSQAGWFLGSDGIRLRLPTTCDSRFIAYQLQGEASRLWLLHHATGTTMASLNQEIIERVPIVLPPIEQQRTIAHILGTLDDKIELNRRMNETLEAMARALFKSWFVDFDPVRAKMEGRVSGLPQHLADLFPDRLVESELGEIPEGWEVESLEMIAQLEKATVKPEDHATEEFEHFSLPAYDSGQLPALDLGSTIKSNKTLVPSQAVLLSKLNPEIQRVWLPASASSRRQISSTEFLVFTPKPPIGRAGLYALFNTQSFRDLLKGMVTGTSKSHQRVAPKSLVTQGMISPADILTNEFEALAWPMFERTLRNKSENHTIAALRDTLLPKLISGELRAKQVEAIA